MKLRSFFFGVTLALCFVWAFSRPNSTLRQYLPGSSGPLFTEAVAAGLGPDETNNIEVYKNGKESVVYITSKIGRAHV